MREIRQIQSLESLRVQPFEAPAALLQWVEDLEEAGDPWLVMWGANSEGAAPKTWLLVDPDTQQGKLFIEEEDEVLEGMWNPQFLRFHAEEGHWVDLMGQFHPYGEDETDEELDDEPEEPLE